MRATRDDVSRPLQVHVLGAAIRATWKSVLLAILIASPALASHTTFSTSCDRFEVDGNVFGPADGGLDFVDDFDGGTLAPNWETFYGTAAESGGSVVLQSPGQDFLIGPTTYDLSNVEASQAVQNGAGNFTMTSYWAATLPALDREFHLELYQDASTPIEVAGLTVSNLSPAIAALQGGGTPAGYSVTQEILHLAFGQPVGAPGTRSIGPCAPVIVILPFRNRFESSVDWMPTSCSVASLTGPFAPSGSR